MIGSARTHRAPATLIGHMTLSFRPTSSECGVCLNSELNSDLEEVVKQEDHNVMERYPKDSFLYLFWQQQKEALTKNPKGMRWHPMMIRSCINLARHTTSYVRQE